VSVVPSAASHHVDVLEAAGLVARRRVGREVVVNTRSWEDFAPLRKRAKR
jgi:DNA-binding transcriptional ArsR family regulator